MRARDLKRLKPGTKLRIRLNKTTQAWHLNPRLCNNKIAYLSYSDSANFDPSIHFIWLQSSRKRTEHTTFDCFTLKELSLVKEQ